MPAANGIRDENSLADLEREWRGGQSQALLTLQGLVRANHQVELVAPNNRLWRSAHRRWEFGYMRHPVRLACLGGTSDGRLSARAAGSHSRWRRSMSRMP